MVAPVPYSIGRITSVTAEFDRKLAAHEKTATKAMQANYRRVIDRLGSDLQAIQRKIAARQAAGLPTPVSWLHKEQRYSSLILQARNGFNEYAQVVRGSLSDGQERVIRLAQQHAEAAIEASLPNAQSIVGTFNSLPKASIKQLRGTLQTGSPLDDILQRFGSDAATAIGQALTNGLAKGLHPDQIAADVMKAADITAAKAAVITRTELYRSYREANRGMYAANKNIVDKWVWFAHLGTHTCVACLAMHGTEHDLDEPMGSHPNCRCTMLPKTKTWEEMGYPGVPETRVTGADVGDAEAWLKAADPQLQKAAFGNNRLLQGWRNGDFDLQDVVRRVDTPEWGTTRTVSGYDAAVARAQARRAAGTGSTGGIDKDAAERARKAAQRRAQRAAQKARELAKTEAERLAAEEAARLAAEESARLATKPKAWHDDARDMIRDGVYDQSQIRQVGKIIREEAERRGVARSPEQIKKINDAIDHLTAKRNVIYDEANKLQVYADDTSISDFTRNFYKDNIKRSLKEAETITKEIDNLIIGRDSVQIKADVWRDVLGEVRPSFGKGTGNLVGVPRKATKDVLALANKQKENFPAEWWEGFQQRQIITKRVQRGYFRQGRDTVEVMVSPGNEEATMIHELTHYAEFTQPRIRVLEQEFYAYRTQGERLTNMSWSSGKEKTRLDKFVSEYMGKDYGNTSQSYYELMTMGTESLFASSPRYNLASDPEYIDFVLGVLAAV